MTMHANSTRNDGQVLHVLKRQQESFRLTVTCVMIREGNPQSQTKEHLLYKVAFLEYRKEKFTLIVVIHFSLLRGRI